LRFDEPKASLSAVIVRKEDTDSGTRMNDVPHAEVDDRSCDASDFRGHATVLVDDFDQHRLRGPLLSHASLLSAGAETFLDQDSRGRPTPASWGMKMRTPIVHKC